MAEAVAGPPILALEAIIASSRLKWKILAPTKEKSILQQTIIKQKSNNNGAVLMIKGKLAGTPITTKKMEIKKLPTTSAPLIRSQKRGKAVANNMVAVVIIKYELPNNCRTKLLQKLSAGITAAK